MLRDDKVMLRAVEPEDLELMYLLENDARLWDCANTSVPYSSHLLKEYIKQCSCNFYEDKAVRMAIALPSGMSVGFIDLQNYEPKHQRAEVGIVLMPDFQHQGLAKHALTLMAEYARDMLHLHQLYAHVHTGNHLALRLFLAAGFIRTATLPQWTCCTDGWQDVAVFQMILTK